MHTESGHCPFELRPRRSTQWRRPYAPRPRPSPPRPYRCPLPRLFAHTNAALGQMVAASAPMAAGILPQMDAASAHMVAASTHRIASAVVSEVSAVKHSAYHRYQPSNVSRAKGITRRLNARVSSRQLLGRGTSELSAVNSLHTTN